VLAAVLSYRSSSADSWVLFIPIGGDLVNNSLYGLLAFVSLLLTVGSFYLYVYRASTAGQTMYVVLALVFLVLTVVFGGLFLSGRVNRDEEIHITE
jgi:hypothetical protein